MLGLIRVIIFIAGINAGLTLSGDRQAIRFTTGAYWILVMAYWSLRA